MMRRLVLALLLAALPCLAGAQTYPTPQLGGLTILLTPDTSYQSFGSAAMVVTAPGNQSPIIGYIYNGLPANAPNLSAGVNGYCKQASAGSQCFGLYGLGELTAANGVAIGGEVTSRNFAGTPDATLPPNEAIGTTTRVTNALQVTAGGTFNSAIGAIFGSEGGASVGFLTDIYLRNYVTYGLFIDAPATGNQTGQVIQNNGNGINLQLGTTLTMQPNNAVITVLDSASAAHFSVRQNGDVYGNSYKVGAGSVAGVTCTAGTVSLSTMTVAGGIVTHC